jgi:hypothetical protein
MMLGWLDNLLGKHPANKQNVNPLAGKPLRYLIGADNDGRWPGHPDEIVEVPYDAEPAVLGLSIGYCNLFDEKNTGKLGPYLHTSGTAEEYREGQIDPRGPGWAKNLREQFERRKRKTFEFIELDNPDAYDIKDVLGAIDLAASYGLKVIAKNPLLMRPSSADYLRHPNVYGAIVEKGAGGPAEMKRLRIDAGKPDLPVWFVMFDDGEDMAKHIADLIRERGHKEMRVTYSSKGEYGNSIDIGG